MGSNTSSGGAAIFLALGCLAAKMFAPPVLAVARAMLWAALLSGRGVMEYHLTSVLIKKIDFRLESWRSM